MFKPQFEYKLSFGWRTGSYFRNGLPQEHFEDKCFYLFQTFMLIEAWVSLKAERRKLLERLGVGTEDTGEKIAPLLSLREALHI